jgi:hypothetical protein
VPFGSLPDRRARTIASGGVLGLNAMLISFDVGGNAGVGDDGSLVTLCEHGAFLLVMSQSNYYHQQYLGKVPNGYCGIGGTGLSCPVGIAPADG